MSNLLTRADAAKIVGITPEGIAAAARRGRLRVAQRTVGGMALYDRNDVEQFKQDRERRQR